MGSPAIFKGPRTGLLSSKGLSLKDGSIVDNDGVPNFVKNGHAEIDTTGWATYADAAGAAPVDGTGGTPNVTWTRTTTTPLAGSGSFLFTKDAVNRQGQGVSFDFTLDPAYRARVVNIQFDYIIASGTFAAGTATTDSDLTVWIYDITNSTLIQPSSFRLLSNNSSIADTFQSSFQTSSTGASYRLIVHCGTTSASAYTVKFDNVLVSPTEYAFGTPVTDWVSYTPNLTTNLGANPVTLNTGAGYVAPNGRWRKVGDNIEIYAHFRNGSGGAATGTAGNLSMSNPSGVSIDTNKIASDGSIGSSNGWAMSNLGGNYSDVQNIYLASNLMQVQQGGTGSYYTLASIAAGFAVHYHGSFPVTGWSSSVQMSDQTSTRVIAAKYTSATASLSAAFSKVTFSTKVIDDTNSYASGTYTVPVAGKYKISATILVARSATVSGNIIQLATFKNGTGQNISLLRDQGTEAQSRSVILNDILDCKAGDTIEIHGYAEGTSPTIPSDSQRNFLVIERLAGPNQIAASEQIVARYTNTAGDSISNTVEQKVTWGNKTFDTHGMKNASDEFVVPISGKYQVDVGIIFASATYVAGNVMNIRIAKNGVSYSLNGVWYAQAAATTESTGAYSDIVDCVAGDKITIYVRNNRTAGATALNTGSSPALNFVSIVRVGN